MTGLLEHLVEGFRRSPTEANVKTPVGPLPFFCSQCSRATIMCPGGLKRSLFPFPGAAHKSEDLNRAFLVQDVFQRSAICRTQAKDLDLP